MILIEKEKVRKYIIAAAIIGSVGGFFISYNSLIIFYIFSVVFILGFIYVKITDFIYKKYFFGGPPVHITTATKTIIIQKLKEFSINNIIDLGSGNGDLCFLLAKNKYIISGIELNLYYFLISKIKNFFTKYKVNFIYGNLWNLNFKHYDCLIIYPISYMVEKLQQKILKEAEKNSIIISYYQKFNKLNCIYENNNVYFYKI